jgi:hypothetical protein
MGLLNTTAIARLVPTPLVWGTTTTVAGTPETIEAGGFGTPLQATRNTDIIRAVEPLEKRRVDM